MDKLLFASAITALTLAGSAALATPSLAQGAITPAGAVITAALDATTHLFVDQDAQAPLAPGASAGGRVDLGLWLLPDEVQAPLTELAGLEDEQRRARAALEELARAVEGVEKSLGENEALVRGNVRELEERIDGLGRRVDDLKLGTS